MWLYLEIVSLWVFLSSGSWDEITLDSVWVLEKLSGVPIIQRGERFEKQIQERRPKKKGDWSDMTICQETPMMPYNKQKPGEWHGMDSTSEHPEGTNPEGILTLVLCPP